MRRIQFVALTSLSLFIPTLIPTNPVWAGDRSPVTNTSILVGQRSIEFDESPINRTPSNNPSVPPYPEQVNPNSPLRHDFSEGGDVPKIFEEIQSDPVLANILGDMPLQLCQMTQTVIDRHRDASKVTPVYMHRPYPDVVRPSQIAPRAIWDKATEESKKLLNIVELMDKLARRKNLHSFIEDRVKEKLQSLVEDAIDGKIKTDLNCSKYAFASEQNVELCNLCKYEGTYRYPKANGDYKGTFDAPCEGSLRQKIGYINVRLSKQSVGINSSYGTPVVSGIPERITQPNQFCSEYTKTPSAIQTAATNAASEIKVCAVPAEFWRSHKRQVGPVNMQETTCIVPGRVMTNEGEVDGQEWVGVCKASSAFGLPPMKKLRSQADDPARRNPVPNCPTN